MSAITTMIVKPDGTVITEHHDRVPPLEFFQKAVGGYIEQVPFFHRMYDQPCVAFCNEEGKLHDLPLNLPATALWLGQAGRDIGDRLVGDVLIIYGDEDLMKEL